MSDTTLTEADYEDLSNIIEPGAGFVVNPAGYSADMLRGIIDRHVVARLAEHARILADVRALADEWNAGVVPYEPHAAELRVVLDGQAPRQGVTSVEDGCTCGGMAACPQCQDRDARQAPTQAEEEERPASIFNPKYAAESWHEDPDLAPARDTDEEGGA